MAALIDTPTRGIIPGAEVDMCPGFVIPENDGPRQVNTWEQSAPVLVNGEARDIRLSNGRLPTRERFAMAQRYRRTPGPNDSVCFPMAFLDRANVHELKPAHAWIWCRILMWATRYDQDGLAGDLDMIAWGLHSKPRHVANAVNALAAVDLLIRDGRGEYWVKDWGGEIFYPRRVPIDLDTRLFVFARDGWKCLKCGRTDKLELDHKMPHSRGGSDDPGNLQTLCRSCNQKKNSRTMEEWLAGDPVYRRRR